MLFYNLVVRLYAFLIRISAFRNAKARQWVQGRKKWQVFLKQQLEAKNTSKLVWVHCASYGEFEQGRPVMEAIRKKHPEYTILLTFFSPSGYEAFKNWRGADIICYLPLDTQRNATAFINLVKPKAAVFIKYEFWLNYLNQLKTKSIPTYLVSAVFKSHHPFFKWYGGIFRKSLLTFTELFVQDQASAALLEGIGIRNYHVSGDTRFDRVVEIRKNFEPLPFFESYCKGATVIVAGSTWPKDEDLLLEVFETLKRKDLKLIFAPHEVDERRISQLGELLTKKQIPYARYTDPNVDLNCQVLIVDTIGLLSRLYHYARITYVGGGFNSGIHNCLEPAVHLKPVIFYGGDDFHKFNEALDLLNLGVAVNVTDAATATHAIAGLLEDDQRLASIAASLQVYFEQNSGTTEKVMAKIPWS